MRQSLGILVASVLFLGGGTAHAKLIGFNGTLSISLRGVPPIVATGSGNALLNGSVGGLGGHLTTLQILTNTVSVTGAIVPITDPAAAPVVSLFGSIALGTGVLRPISGASGPGLTQNVMPVAGAFGLCLNFMGCFGLPPSIPLTVGGTRGVGIGGLITLDTFGGGIKFSIYGQPWTVGTALVDGIPTDNGGFSTTSAFGFAHGPASATSSTAAISGVVQLVTATRIVSTLGITLITPLFTTLTLHLVPEPGTFVLFGSGVLALGIAGRRRVQKK